MNHTFFEKEIILKLFVYLNFSQCTWANSLFRSLYLLMLIIYVFSHILVSFNSNKLAFHTLVCFWGSWCIYQRIQILLRLVILVENSFVDRRSFRISSGSKFDFPLQGVQERKNCDTSTHETG